MRVFLAVALLGSAAAPARADFQLAPTRQAAVPAIPTGPGPLDLLPESPAPARRPAAPLVLPVAHGFGRRVPLAFAARQIVPARVKVTFGAGVDPEAPVDWTGGRPWDRALRAAVKPLGLRVVVGWMTVSIVRA